MRSDLIDIDVTVHHETEKAWLVSSDVSTPEKVWLPKSMCEVSDQKPAPSKAGTLTAPQSFLRDKGLI